MAKNYEERVSEAEELLGPCRVIAQRNPIQAYEISVGVMIASAVLVLAAAIKEAGEKK